jgi:hypothetical protein
LIYCQHRSNFNCAARWPGSSQAKSFVEVGHRDLNVATDDLVALNEWTIVDEWLTLFLEAYGRRRLRGLELVAGTEPGSMLFKPAAYLGILGAPIFFGHIFPGLLLLTRSTE